LFLCFLFVIVENSTIDTIYGDKKKKIQEVEDIVTKFDTEKFFKHNDFGLWKIEKQVILIQQGCFNAMKSEVSNIFVSKGEGLHDQ